MAEPTAPSTSANPVDADPAADGRPTGADALRGLRVLDLSEHLSGQYAARLMADAGADVILVEPVRGSDLRYAGPFWPDGRRPDDSILFWHLNSGKRSFTLDWSTPTGRQLLLQLAPTADVVVSSRQSGADVAGLEAELARVVPGPICRVDDFAREAAFGGWAGSELIHQALSGTMAENGRADGQPLHGVGHRAYYAAGTAAYLSTLAALLAGEPSGRLDPAISVAETAASMNYNRATQYWYSGGIDERGDPKTPRMTLHCRDGWIVSFPTQRAWVATCHVFRAPELAEREDFATELGRLSRWREIEAIFAERLADVDRDDVIAEAQAAKVVAAKVATPADLWADDHLRQRAYWQELADDGADSRPMLGPVYRYHPTDRRRLRRPPRLGEHARELLADLGVSPDEYDLLRETGVI